MKNLVRSLGVLATILVVNCSSERTVQPVSEPKAPDVRGVWQGMLTFTAYFDFDSLDFTYARTQITFADSTWGYYHMLPNGDVMAPWYICNSTESRYYVTDTSLHLRDACVYQTIYDGRIMFLSDYSLKLDGERLVLRYSVYNPSMEAEVQQVVDLRRDSD